MIEKKIQSLSQHTEKLLKIVINLITDKTLTFSIEKTALNMKQDQNKEKVKKEQLSQNKKNKANIFELCLKIICLLLNFSSNEINQIESENLSQNSNSSLFVDSNSYHWNNVKSFVTSLNTYNYYNTSLVSTTVSSNANSLVLSEELLQGLIERLKQIWKDMILDNSTLILSTIEVLREIIKGLKSIILVNNIINLSNLNVFNSFFSFVFKYFPYAFNDVNVRNPSVVNEGKIHIMYFNIELCELILFYFHQLNKIDFQVSENREISLISYKELPVYKVNYSIVKNFLIDEIDNIIKNITELHSEKKFNSLFNINVDFLQKILKHSLFLMTEEFIATNINILNSNEKYIEDTISLEIILKNLEKLLNYFKNSYVNTNSNIFEESSKLTIFEDNLRNLFSTISSGLYEIISIIGQDTKNISTNPMDITDGSRSIINLLTFNLTSMLSLSCLNLVETNNPFSNFHVISSNLVPSIKKLISFNSLLSLDTSTFSINLYNEIKHLLVVILSCINKNDYSTSYSNTNNYINLFNNFLRTFDLVSLVPVGRYFDLFSTLVSSFFHINLLEEINQASDMNELSTKFNLIYQKLILNLEIFQQFLDLSCLKIEELSNEIFLTLFKRYSYFLNALFNIYNRFTFSDNTLILSNILSTGYKYFDLIIQFFKSKIFFDDIDSINSFNFHINSLINNIKNFSNNSPESSKINSSIFSSSLCFYISFQYINYFFTYTNSDSPQPMETDEEKGEGEEVEKEEDLYNNQELKKYNKYWVNINANTLNEMIILAGKLYNNLSLKMIQFSNQNSGILSCEINSTYYFPSSSILNYTNTENKFTIILNLTLDIIYSSILQFPSSSDSSVFFSDVINFLYGLRSLILSRNVSITSYMSEWVKKTRKSLEDKFNSKEQLLTIDSSFADLIVSFSI